MRKHIQVPGTTGKASRIPTSTIAESRPRKQSKRPEQAKIDLALRCSSCRDIAELVPSATTNLRARQSSPLDPLNKLNEPNEPNKLNELGVLTNPPPDSRLLAGSP